MVHLLPCLTRTPSSTSFLIFLIDFSTEILLKAGTVFQSYLLWWTFQVYALPPAALLPAPCVFLPLARSARQILYRQPKSLTANTYKCKWRGGIGVFVSAFLESFLKLLIAGNLTIKHQFGQQAAHPAISVIKWMNTQKIMDEHQNQN